MPKTIELTVEIEVQRVSCPGVWLCQDGRVSLTVFALGTSYQTCLLPPMFPLMFKDVFYFKKRFQETCALNNICCLLEQETLYCELVQWSENCLSGECTILAQYLGALNDILFPPNMCSNDGVDLLMKRSRKFPGILSPKIEIATKVRIDEVWNNPLLGCMSKKVSCHCTQSDAEGARQKPVCHTANYHRSKCNLIRPIPKRLKSRSRSRSGSRSDVSRSCCSVTPQERDHAMCKCPILSNDDNIYSVTSASLQKFLLESRYIDEESPRNKPEEDSYKMFKTKVTPCVCEICKRYYELFHSDSRCEC